MTALPNDQPLSAPVEDYLKTIYDIGGAEGVANTTDIAAALALAPASVSGMVRRLADQGLIAHERYRGVRLTLAGRRAALRTIRRHRVLETYLMRVLGYSWDRVHDEAERLEHAASDELIDRMAAAMGEPATDPHGAPIPTREGEVVEPALTPLSALSAGERAVVQRVDDRDPSRLRYLAELGLLPGSELEVTDRAPFEGPITVALARGETRVIGNALAAGVLVSPTP